MMRMSWVVVIMVMIGCWMKTEAQSLDCTKSLGMCWSPLKNSSESPSQLGCCIPLKEAVVNQKTCLCNLLNNKEALKSFNVTSDEIFSLTKRCDISEANPSMCSAAVPSSPPPPGTVAPPPPGTKAGTANAVGWSSGISILLALLTSLLVF